MRHFILISLLCCVSLHAQSKYQGYVGAGFTTPVGSFGNRHDTGWNFLAGGGYKFTDQISLNLEYTFNQLDYAFTPTTPGGELIQQLLNGTTEVNGFTLAPRYTVGMRKGIDVYFTAAYGIYARTFQLSRPTVGTTVVCDPYWYWCGTAVVPVDVILGSNTTWKQGWNAGMGVEGGGRIKFFAEARYQWIATPNVRLKTIPVVFGVRF